MLLLLDVGMHGCGPASHAVCDIALSPGHVRTSRPVVPNRRLPIPSADMITSKAVPSVPQEYCRMVLDGVVGMFATIFGVSKTAQILQKTVQSVANPRNLCKFAGRAEAACCLVDPASRGSALTGVARNGCRVARVEIGKGPVCRVAHEVALRMGHWRTSRPAAPDWLSAVPRDAASRLVKNAITGDNAFGEARYVSNVDNRIHVHVCGAI